MGGLWWKSGVLAVILSAGLHPAGPSPQPRPTRMVELRDQFIRQEVVRPFRERMGRDSRRERESRGQTPADVHGPRKDEVVPVVPFLLPYAGGPSCVEQVCRLVGSLGCDSEERITRVFRMCYGNYSGDCVRAVCARLISVECDTPNAVQPVAEACRSNLSGDCLEAACRLVGDVGCQTLAQMSRILDACAGNVDGSCVAWVCTNLGSVHCATVDDLLPVARTCGRY